MTDPQNTNTISNLTSEPYNTDETLYKIKEQIKNGLPQSTSGLTIKQPAATAETSEATSSCALPPPNPVTKPPSSGVQEVPREGRLTDSLKPPTPERTVSNQRRPLISSDPTNTSGAAPQSPLVSSAPAMLESPPPPQLPSKNKRGRPSKGDPRPKKPRSIHPHSARPGMTLLYRDMKTLSMLEDVVKANRKHFAGYYSGSPAEPLTSDLVQKIHSNIVTIKKVAVELIDECEQQLRSVVMSPCEIVFAQMLLCRAAVVRAKCGIYEEDARQLFNLIRTDEKRAMFQAVVEECDIPFSAMKNSRNDFYVHLARSSNVKEVRAVSLDGTKDKCPYDAAAGVVRVNFPFAESTRGSAGDVKIPLRVQYTVYKADDASSSSTTSSASSSIERILEEVVVATPRSKVTVRTNDNQIGKHEHRAIVARVLGSEAAQPDVRVSWERAVNVAQLYIALKAPRMQHMKPSKGSSSVISAAAAAVAGVGMADEGDVAEESPMSHLKAIFESMNGVDTGGVQPPEKRQKADGDGGCDGCGDNILPGDADKFIEKYKHYKRDYLSVADYEVLWKTLFEKKYSGSGMDVEREGRPRRMLSKEDVELFIEVIMAFVSTLKTQMIAYLWNAGYVVGFLDRNEAANIALRMKRSIIRLSCKVDPKGDKGESGEKASPAGEPACEVKWVITNKNDTHIQLNNLVGTSVEKVAELIKENPNIDDFGYVENTEKNFLGKSAMKKFFVGEREIDPEVKEVRKGELFDGIVKKKDDVVPSVPKVPGYIDLMVRAPNTFGNLC